MMRKIISARVIFEIRIPEDRVDSLEMHCALIEAEEALNDVAKVTCVSVGVGEKTYLGGSKAIR